MRIISDILAVIVASILSLPVLVVVMLPVFAVGILDAYVIASVWRWFAVPFLGVKALSTGAAYGLNCLVWAFIRRHSDMTSITKSNSKTPLKDAATALGKILLGILLGWGVAYLTARYWTHTY